jgi:membrane-associated phospholipid phosphatase
MHHPTDVLAGALLGAAALVVACVAVRAARADDRDEPRREVTA